MTDKIEADLKYTVICKLQNACKSVSLKPQICEVIMTLLIVVLAFLTHELWKTRNEPQSVESITSLKRELFSQRTTRASIQSDDTPIQAARMFNSPVNFTLPSNGFKKIHWRRPAVVDTTPPDTQVDLSSRVYVLPDDPASPMSRAMETFNSGYYVEAAKLLLPLATAGNPKAQYKLGLMYSTGKGLPHDDNQAALWYLKSANQNYDFAQFELAEMYRKGLVTNHNTFSISKLFSTDSIASISNREAASWYQKAANNRFPKAQYALGLLYAKGELGLHLDYVQAYMWLMLAGGIAINDLRWLEGMMTVEQVTKAKTLAEQWRENNK